MRELLMADRVIPVSDDEAAVEAEPVVLDVTDTAIQFTLDDGVSFVVSRVELLAALSGDRSREAA